MTGGGSMKEGTHIPQRQHRGLDLIMLDVLEYSAKTLRVGGRVVFWLPCPVK